MREMRHTTNPALVCKAEAPYVCVHANREWEALSGYSSADMTGEK